MSYLPVELGPTLNRASETVNKVEQAHPVSRNYIGHNGIEISLP